MPDATDSRRTLPLVRFALAVAVAVGALVFATGAVAGTFDVTKTTDDDGACFSGNCALREAVLAANISISPDTINVPAGVYTLTIVGDSEEEGFTGDIDIKYGTTIIGAGSGLTVIDASALVDTDRHFQIRGLSGTTTISGVTLINGSGGQGSAIHVSSGARAILTDIEARDNTSVGINVNTNAIVDLVDTTIGPNNAIGIINEGDLVITGSTITGNGPTPDGAGIANDPGATLEITDSEISGNGALSRGGGIFNAPGATISLIENSTISGNSSNSLGGGLHSDGDVNAILGTTISGNTAAGFGGGIFNNFGSLTITNSTLSENSAFSAGSGIYNDSSGTLTARHVTIVGPGEGVNVIAGGVLTLQNTLVATTGADCAGTGTPTSLGGNLDTDGTCILTGTGDIPAGNSALGPLQDNGGPTETHALGATSAAIDTGLNGACPATDQRGQARVDGDANGTLTCDIGAFEFQAEYSTLDPGSAAGKAATKCYRAILKESLKYQGKLQKTIDKCKKDVVKKGGASAFTLADCALVAGDANAGTAEDLRLKARAAEQKLLDGIAKQCGGSDKACGTGTNDVPLQHVNWDNGTCPVFENFGCESIALDDCGGIGACLACQIEGAMEQAMDTILADPFNATAFGATIEPGKTTNKCQQTILKEGGKFVSAKRKVLQKCWDKKVKRKGDGYDDPVACPDVDPKLGGTGDPKTVEAILKLEQKKTAAICKKCGGDGDSDKDGLCDTNPASLPFLGGSYTCPAIQLPPSGAGILDGEHRYGTDCGALNPIATLQDYIDCIDCVLEFKADCLAHAAGGDHDPSLGIGYPAECEVAFATSAITEIVDETGDGGSAPLSGPFAIAVDDNGNVYTAGFNSNNVLRIAPNGTVTEIIDSTGDGGGNPLVNPEGIAVDGAGNVYVVGGDPGIGMAFTIDTPGTCSTSGIPCSITKIIDSTGDGISPFEIGFGIATDGSGNVYVTGYGSENAFKITPGGTVTEIIDSTGDGGGNPLNFPTAIAVDGSGNVYVAGAGSDNAFKITPGGTVTEIIDSTGDGGGNPLVNPEGIAVDGSGNVYVTGFSSDNAFKITPGGTVTEIIDSNADGVVLLNSPSGVAVDGSGNVYISAASNNAFKVTPGGTVTKIIDVTGDGLGNTLSWPYAIALNGDDVYVTGSDSNNAFHIATVP